MADRTNAHEHVATETADLRLEQIAALKQLFPEVLTEGKVDFDRLRYLLGDAVETRTERYTFSWAGKRDAIRLLQVPSYATLIPVPEESVAFDETNHLFIEGDNLEILKQLHKSYFNRVKVIYIDPPYNTGKDFVYSDDYADPLGAYLARTGQKDSEGNLLTSNPETSGRYHSAWLSMMYPRLFLARQLLREDGVILVSIDDHEVYNLRFIMNEIFGEENFIAELVWEKTRKNDAKLFSVGHEYMLVYGRSLATLKSLKTVWRETKPGAKEIMEQYQLLRAQFGNDDRAVEAALRTWYQSLPDKHPSKKLSRYKQVDKYGPWRDRDISWPGGGGPTYDVIHPKTKLPCKVPEAGWRFATPEAMQEQIRLGLVVFRADHTEPPIRKAHLIPVPEELDDDDAVGAEEDETESDDTDAIGLQVMPSVIQKQAQVAVKHLRKLMGGKIFDNPKDHEVLARLFKYVTSPTNADIILDFFAGSCSTAEAVFRLNHEDDGNRRFVCVQLPESTPEKSPARKAGYATVGDIGKERMRRVIAAIQAEAAGKLGLSTRPTPEDLGFRVFKLAESNLRQWRGRQGSGGESYVDQLALFADQLLPGKALNNAIWEVAIREGYGLNARMAALPDITENTISRVLDPDKGQSFYICLDQRIHLEALRPLALNSDNLFVCRDAALDDTTAANLALQCRLKTI